VEKSDGGGRAPYMTEACLGLDSLPAVKYSSVQYSTVQYSTGQYSACPPLHLLLGCFRCCPHASDKVLPCISIIMYRMVTVPY